MSAPAGYKQLPSGFWVKDDGSGPYFIDVETGIATAVGSGVTNVNGVDYIRMSSGALMPLAGVVGDGEIPLIGGTPIAQVLLDEGSDANHAKLLITANCNIGPSGIDTPDTALASDRFNAGASNVEVFDYNIAGGDAGSIVPIFPNGGGLLTMLHLARADSGTYTQAAGATITARQMVLARWDSSLGVIGAVLYIGNSYNGGGSNQRYRPIIIVGFKQP